jgi:hypothetical protein
MSDDESRGAAPRPPRIAERTALDVRADHRVLQSFSDSELRAMPLLGEGEVLARRGHYVDLHDPARAGFVAEGDEVVEPGQHVVARSEVSDKLWDELQRACDSVLGRRSLTRLRPAV